MITSASTPFHPHAWTPDGETVTLDAGVCADKPQKESAGTAFTGYERQFVLQSSQIDCIRPVAVGAGLKVEDRK